MDEPKNHRRLSFSLLHLPFPSSNQKLDFSSILEKSSSLIFYSTFLTYPSSLKSKKKVKGTSLTAILSPNNRRSIFFLPRNFTPRV